MKTTFLKTNAVKKYVSEKGRRTSKEFIGLLDGKVQELLDAAIDVHNGGKKTLDADVAGYCGIKGR